MDSKTDWEGSKLISFGGISGVGKTDFVRIAAGYLEKYGLCVTTFSENEYDPIRDNIAMINKIIKENLISCKLDQILGVLFALGRSLLIEKLKKLRSQFDVVVLDRCLWDNVCYQSEPDGLSMEALYTLNVKMGVLVPDLSFIIDGDISNCLERRALRDKKPSGTAGQMAGDQQKRQRIKKRFLSLSEVFPGHGIEIISNPGDPTDDLSKRQSIAQENVKKIVLPIIEKHGIIP
ncbi:MAG: hypothetical protein V1838_01590 [Patescibacteria group bacterium]